MITEPGLYNLDCMVALKEYPDNYFDLAIVDPPYGDAGGVQWNGEIRRTVRPIPRDGFHGKSYGGGTTHYERPQKRTESTGLVEHGRRSSEKNHFVGHSPGPVVF